MKSNLLPALRLTVVCLLFFSGVYIVAVWGIARLLPRNGMGARIEHSAGYYYAHVGQPFEEDRYFWPRPSAVGYDAGGSGGSNKGPSNPEYLQTVQARVDTFLLRNPGIDRADIPSDLVTASGSGLDPHLSPQAALVQVERVARVRHLDPDKVHALVLELVEQPVFGIFGNEKINVLRLNIALDNL